MSAMNRYLAGVLTVIAMGVSAIAYSLVFPRTTSTPVGDATIPATATVVGARAMLLSDAPTASPHLRSAPLVYASAPGTASWMTTEPSDREPRDSVSDEPVVARATRTVRIVEVDEPVRTAPRTARVVERPRRDWKRTAMIIGGTTAASAGVGGIVGGKKGALIGAAIGGGASTIYETTKGR